MTALTESVVEYPEANLNALLWVHFAFLPKPISGQMHGENIEQFIKAKL